MTLVAAHVRNRPGRRDYRTATTRRSWAPSLSVNLRTSASCSPWARRSSLVACVQSAIWVCFGLRACSIPCQRTGRPAFLAIAPRPVYSDACWLALVGSTAQFKHVEEC